MAKEAEKFTPKTLVNKDDDIPFTSQDGDSTLGVSEQRESPAKIHLLQDEIKSLQEENERLAVRVNDLLEEESVSKKDCFLAILSGMASNGDFTVGSKLNSDDSIRNAARHAAGVASFFYNAAKEARI